jgi:hypothetical protein
MKFGISPTGKFLAIGMGLVVAGTTAFASNTSFSNGNSTVTLDPTSASGMSSWTVDGQNVLNQQSFWLGIGGGNVNPLSSLGVPTVSSASVSPGFSTLSTIYNNGQVSVQAVYSLVGGSSGSGNADLGEQIQIQNLTGSALTFHFYQYADFQNVNSTQLTSSSLGFFGNAFVTGSGMSVTENVNTGVIPGPSHGETQAHGVTLAKLLAGTPLTLSDNSTGGAGSTWAFEWDKTVPAGSTLIISKDMNVTLAPEPATWSLISIGLLGLGFVRRSFSRGSK